MSNNKIGFCPEHDEQDICSGFLYWYDKTPDALALFINDKGYSYQEMYAAAFSIYKEIKQYKEDRIGVWCENDVYSYAAILAISMTGACYVPLNAKFPSRKLNTIIADCGLKLVISGNDLNENDFFADIKIVSPVLDFKQAGEIEKTIEQPLAYILYTSGTTGLPKGVPVKKSSVNSFFTYFIRQFDFKPSDRFLQAYELSFDVSVFSIFCAWNAGASVFPVKDNKNKFLEIFKTIQDHELTVCSMVPGVLGVVARYFRDFGFPFVRYSFFSGDALYYKWAKEWKQCIPHAEIHNFYGPTETTIVCTHYKWMEEIAGKDSVNGIVPIGKPFPGMEFILVDEALNELNPNEHGELCFTGKQVIDAYINNAATESFFEHKGKRYYRTGDWCGIDGKGDLLFYGRNDKQVKVNGYRVELAEIENVIRNITSANCRVLLETTQPVDQLIAFVEAESHNLKNDLMLYLPDYMIPSRFIFVEQLPLTLNNKIDEARLKTILNE